MDFGATTWDLDEKFEAPTEEHEFYKGETFSLSKPVRLGGLAAHEVQMIEWVIDASDPQASDQKLKTFSQNDGHLTYFSHRPSSRQFVKVAHFPGDNEFGLLVEIKVLESGTEIVGIMARINDGAIAPLPGPT